MEPPESSRIFEHVDKLTYEFGPRIAGGKGEKLACQYVFTVLKEGGLKPKKLEFSFYRLRSPYLHLLSLPFLIHPLLSLLVWLVLLFLVHERVKSCCILAGDEKPKTVFAAGLDSPGAPAGLILELPFVLITLLLVARLFLDFPIWPFLPLWFAVPIAWKKPPASLAVGEATALATGLELVKSLKGNGVMFVALGASRAFGYSRLVRLIPKDATVVFLEKLGGESLYWCGDVDLSQMSGQNLKLVKSRTPVYDFFKSRGFKCVCLSSSPSTDRPEGISAETLEKVLPLLLKLAGEVTDASLKRDNGN